MNKTNETGRFAHGAQKTRRQARPTETACVANIGTQEKGQKIYANEP